MTDSRNVPDMLKKIVETKQGEVLALAPSVPDLKKRALDRAPALDFKAAVARAPAVIAEIKRASPSAGVISESFDPEAVARAYLAGGASAVSVLTDRTYFGGAPEYIPMTKKILRDIPVLRKDFIIDSSQIYEAACLGADSFLLIAELLGEGELRDFILLGRELGMEPLVEAHDAEAVGRAVSAGAAIIGVNNRNLRDFTVDIRNSARLRPLIPAGVVAVSESGIRSAGDAAVVYGAGYHAVLVGESLMRKGEGKCGELINEFKKAGRGF